MLFLTLNIFYTWGESETMEELFPNIGTVLLVHILLLFYDFDFSPIGKGRFIQI